MAIIDKNTWQDSWQDLTRHDRTRPDLESHGKTRLLRILGNTGIGRARQDLERRDPTWRDMSGLGKIRQDMTRHDKTSQHDKTWQVTKDYATMLLTCHGETWRELPRLLTRHDLGELAKLHRTWQDMLRLDRTRIEEIWQISDTGVRGPDKSWQSLTGIGGAWKDMINKD